MTSARPASLTPFAAQPTGPDGLRAPLQPTRRLARRGRGEFLVRVYQHLLAALLAFVAFEALLINLGAAEVGRGSTAAAAGSCCSAFMVVSWLATNAARHPQPVAACHRGLFALAAAEAVIFALPPLHLRGPGRRRRPCWRPPPSPASGSPDSAPSHW